MAAIPVWIHLGTQRSLWLLKLEHTSFGPAEVIATAERNPLGRVRLRSSSGALTELRALPEVLRVKSIDLSSGAWAFSAWPGEGAFAGESLASRRGDPITFRMTAAELTGAIGKGWFRGPFQGKPMADLGKPLRPYPEVVKALETALRANLYDPSLVDSPSVRAYLDRLARVARAAHDDADLLLAARWAWDGAPPFSHFELRRSDAAAGELAARFEAMELGPEGVQLRQEGDIAVLQVKRLLGKDTPGRIEAALREVALRSPRGLVLDLRGNPGGAFALVPLIAPLIDRPLVAGVFTTRLGRGAHPQGVDAPTLAALPAWKGTTLADWWRSLATEPLVKVVIQPSQPAYRGPVAVLVDGKTESAAEMAAQALRDAGRAQIFGERTGGRMLSSAYFDLGQGFQAVIPVGDYHAGGFHRLEGVGLVPDRVVAADQALAAALEFLSRKP